MLNEDGIPKTILKYQPKNTPNFNILYKFILIEIYNYMYMKELNRNQ